MTGAGACPSLRALGENAHSPLTPTPSAAPGTRTRGVAISRPQCFSCPLTWNLPHPWPATAVRWFQPVGNVGRGLLRHRLATLSRVPRGHGPATVLCRDRLSIQFSVQRFDPACTPWGIRHCVDISGHTCP
nr:MAG TPA: hypothetical protein [Caudoviricetes sp.]